MSGPGVWSRGRGRGRGRGFGNRGGGLSNGFPRPQASSLSAQELEETLLGLDGQQYGRLKALQGNSYPFSDEEMTLFIDRVQSDPFAPPSNIRIKVPNSFSPSLFSTKIRKIALEDYLARALKSQMSRVSKGVNSDNNNNGNWNSPKGGNFCMDSIGQQVLPKTCVLAHTDCIEARLTYSFPARGRTIFGHQAANSLLRDLPLLINASLFSGALDAKQLMSHIESIEDQEALRSQVKSSDLLCFIRNGACLPRAAGNSDLPMKGAILFQSPPTLELSFDLPNCGKICGMGIPRGVTLIAGGGFHGKSTLLDAIQSGVYNHIPGDGRDFVATDDRVCKIRAEDGRNISSVDISPFINNIPFGRDTTQFCTEDASGSTSMAASIQEALEIDCRGLLFDEDTCATNFLIRDERMEMLVSRDNEPITPLIMKIRSLYKERNCSSILVVGGCGSYLDVADTVIMMESYKAIDATEKARSIAASCPLGIALANASYGPKTFRIVRAFPNASSYGGGREDAGDLDSQPALSKFSRSKARQMNLITFSGIDIDLSSLEQIVHLSQSRMILDTLLFIQSNGSFSQLTVAQMADKIERLWEEQGLDVVKRDACPPCNYAEPRKFELIGALNRLRGVSFQISY